MQWRNSEQRFGLIAGLFHWAIVLGIIVQYVLAEVSEDAAEGSGGFDTMSLHRSIGFAILALAIARLAWRFVSPPPQWPTSMKPYEVAIAQIVHVTFYALLFAIPISGWALSSAEGDALSFFGLFTLPSLPAGAAMEDTLEEVHETLFNGLFVLALLHVVAALKHQFIDRDSVLRSMLPGRG